MSSNWRQFYASGRVCGSCAEPLLPSDRIALVEIGTAGDIVRSSPWHERCADPLSIFTAQELRVGRLAVAGVATPGIAAQMFLSPHTVKGHFHRMGRKVRGHGRMDIVQYIRRAEAKRAA